MLVLYKALELSKLKFPPAEKLFKESTHSIKNPHHHKPVKAVFGLLGKGEKKYGIQKNVYFLLLIFSLQSSEA
jgi:hypothetical protein